MTGLIHKALVLAAVGLLAPMGAMGSPPNPATSDAPTYISLGGMNGQGVPDPFVTVTYVMRNANNTPVANTSVVLNFAQCTDIVLGPGTGVNCGAKTFMGATDGFGRLSVTLSGHGNGAGPPRSVCDCVTVTGGGQPFPNIGVSTLDRDGVNGVGASDLTLFILDWLNHANPTACRSDFSGDDALGAGDLALLVHVFVLDQSPMSSSCPP